jgi:23S rRNA (cytidine1920-2'-O)/16S rRNA (cytidine1409-2'-O)-methyltransferase
MAKAEILAGSVEVDGVVVMKPSTQVGASQAIDVRSRSIRYVSRAGGKLAAAIDAFSIDPAGARCVDAGSSTGGFTDCLLHNGAATVVAVDVGTDQLHPKVRSDERVVVLERTDIRSVVPHEIGGPFDLVVADLSFISLTAVLAALAALVAGHGNLVVLVKPQFEAGREAVATGKGVIRDPSIWRQALVDVVSTAADYDLSLSGATVSPITGASGNVEFAVWLQPADRTMLDVWVGSDATIDGVVAAAEVRVA